MSRRVPGVNFSVAVTPENVGLHTPEFTKAVVSPKGHEAVLRATKVAAMTAIDLLTDTEILRRARDEFVRYKSSGFANLPLLPLF